MINEIGRVFISATGSDSWKDPSNRTVIKVMPTGCEAARGIEIWGSGDGRNGVGAGKERDQQFCFPLLSYSSACPMTIHLKFQ